MGLHTTYVGRVDIAPPLRGETADWLRAFASTRHWDHPDGPLRVAQHPADDEPVDSDLARYNRTAPGLPSLYCPWTVCEDGCCLRWDGHEKPYAGKHWLEWLIDNVLAPDHVASGMLIGESRESGMVTALEVVSNEVTAQVLVPARPESGASGCDDQGERLADRAQQVLRRARRFRAGLEAERETAPGRLRRVGAAPGAGPSHPVSREDRVEAAPLPADDQWLTQLTGGSPVHPVGPSPDLGVSSARPPRRRR